MHARGAVSSRPSFSEAGRQDKGDRDRSEQAARRGIDEQPLAWILQQVQMWIVNIPRTHTHRCHDNPFPPHAPMTEHTNVETFFGIFFFYLWEQ